MLEQVQREGKMKEGAFFWRIFLEKKEMNQRMKRNGGDVGDVG